MILFLHLLKKWQTILLGALAALILFLPIPAVTWSYFRPPPPACEVLLSNLRVSVYVGQERREQVSLTNDMTKLKPIRIDPNQSVAIIAEVEPRPEGCQGTSSFDWELSFVVFIPSQLKISTESLSRSQLELDLTPRVSATSGEDYLTLVMKNSAGKVVRRVSIPLKGE